MLGGENSGSLINAAYRFRTLPYSDNSQPPTDDVVPWAPALHKAAPKDTPRAAVRKHCAPIFRQKTLVPGQMVPPW